MSRGNRAGEGPSWADIAQNVEEWETRLGVQICVQIMWRHNLTTGAWVEVVIREGRVIGTGEELQRNRAAFPTRKGVGHAGAILNAIVGAVNAMEQQPWCWSALMRREALRQA